MAGAGPLNRADVDRLGERGDDVLVAPWSSTGAVSDADCFRALERGSGHLVYVSSLAGKVASAGSSVYTKFAVCGVRLHVRASGDDSSSPTEADESGAKLPRADAHAR